MKRIIKQSNKNKQMKTTFKIDGNRFCILWGENLQVGHALFAETIGEIRRLYLEYMGKNLCTGNEMIDKLMAPEKTVKDYLEAYTNKDN